MMTVYYNLAEAPVTFDAALFFAFCDMRRRIVGEKTMRVVFVPAEGDGFRQITPRDLEFGFQRKYARLWNILVPLARLVPAVTGIEILSSAADLQRVVAETPPDQLFPPLGAKCPYQYPHIQALVNKGVDPCCFKSRSRSPGGDYATITLRRSDFQPDRNSNMQVFGEVADYLKSLGLKVWCIPDSEFPNDYGTLEPYWRAAFDLDMRMALYEGAQINILSSNGPTVLPIYGATKPNYVIGPHLLGNYDTTAEAFFKQHELPLDKDYPFATPKQKLLWRDGSTEAFIAAINGILEIKG